MTTYSWKTAASVLIDLSTCANRRRLAESFPLYLRLLPVQQQSWRQDRFAWLGASESAHSHFHHRHLIFLSTSRLWRPHWSSSCKHMRPFHQQILNRFRIAYLLLSLRFLSILVDESRCWSRVVGRKPEAADLWDFWLDWLIRLKRLLCRKLLGGCLLAWLFTPFKLAWLILVFVE